MQCRFREKFLKDLSKIRDKKLLNSIRDAILNVETAHSFSDIKNFKKLKGYRTAFRIRVGDYRIGIFTDGAIM